MFTLEYHKYEKLTKLIPADFPDRAVLMAILEGKLPAEVM